MLLLSKFIIKGRIGLRGRRNLKGLWVDCGKCEVDVRINAIRDLGGLEAIAGSSGSPALVITNDPFQGLRAADGTAWPTDLLFAAELLG